MKYNPFSEQELLTLKSLSDTIPSCEAVSIVIVKEEAYALIAYLITQIETGCIPRPTYLFIVCKNPTMEFCERALAIGADIVSDPISVGNIVSISTCRMPDQIDGPLLRNKTLYPFAHWKDCTAWDWINIFSRKPEYGYWFDLPGRELSISG